MRKILSTIVLALGLFAVAVPVAAAQSGTTPTDPATFSSAPPLTDLSAWLSADVPTDCAALYSDGSGLINEREAYMSWQSAAYDDLFQLWNTSEGARGSLKALAHRRGHVIHRLRRTVSRQHIRILELRAEIKGLKEAGH